MKKKLDVVMLVDLPTPSNGNSLIDLLKDPEWKTENDVYLALSRLGHDIRVVGLFDDINPIIRSIKERKPNIVFNMAEHFNNNTTLERDVVALLELLDVPFTGTGPTGLMLCKNKGLMKKLLTFHKIKTPHFSVLNLNKPIFKPKHLKYPIIIKPSHEDASYGISQASFVENDAALQDRVKFVHESMKQNALIEEYIEGRELYIGILGIDRLRVLPPRELIFRQVPEDEPKIATFKAKWDEEYRKKWGINSQFANPMAEGVLEKIKKVCKRVYRILHIQGYGRIDLRLTPSNDIMILEANPNPGITRDEELPLAADKDGISFDQLIQNIINTGLKSHQKEPV